MNMAARCGQVTKVPSLGSETLSGAAGARPTVDVNVADTVLFAAARRVTGVAVPRTQRGFCASRLSNQP